MIIACSLGTGPRVGANSENIYIACSLGTGPRVGSNTEDMCSLQSGYITLSRIHSSLVPRPRGSRESGLVFDEMYAMPCYPRMFSKRLRVLDSSQFSSLHAHSEIVTVQEG